jgi:N-methylhydantoinase A/oxoprolinase/acetone carboxylase beta subunit
MSDSFTEITRQGWLSRIGESFKGILFGIIVIPLCLILLWWNEGRAVTTARSLAEGAAAVVAVQPDKVDSANDKKLVHITGAVKADADVVDDQFKVTAAALKLIRNVEIYQWVEDKKTEKKQNTGGSEETRTTYTYKKEWVDEPVRSQNFKQPAGHENTGDLIAESGTFIPGKVTLGAFEVTESLIERMSGR